MTRYIIEQHKTNHTANHKTLSNALTLDIVISSTYYTS
jgi:hypothetical protein